jgi:hypothetical protein
MRTEHAPVDKNVVIPAAVKAAAARSDAAFKAANGIKDEPVTPDGNAADTAKIAEPKDPPAPPVTVSEPAPKTPETPPVQPVVAKEENWERKYSSMKGRHDSLKDQVAQMSEQISLLQNTIATMQTKPVAPAAPPPIESLITADEQREYGTDFLNVVGKKAKEELTPEVASLRQEVNALKSQLGSVGEVTAQQARDRMFAGLDQGCETWRTINHDQAFKDWLRLPDAYSGAIRHELLKAAYERNDTPRVLAFFKGFLAEEAATDPAREETRQPENTGKVSLETLAAPGRAKSAAGTPPPAEKPIIKRSDISKFYADVSRGVYRGRDEEKIRFERAMISAENEGRIQ